MICVFIINTITYQYCEGQLPVSSNVFINFKYYNYYFSMLMNVLNEHFCDFYKSVYF